MDKSTTIDPLDRPNNVDVRLDAEHPVFAMRSEDGGLTRNGVTFALELAGFDVSGDNATWAIRTIVRDGAVAMLNPTDLNQRFQSTLEQLQ